MTIGQVIELLKEIFALLVEYFGGLFGGDGEGEDAEAQA